MSNINPYKKIAFLVIPFFIFSPLVPSQGAILGTSTIKVQNTEMRLKEMETKRAEIKAQRLEREARIAKMKEEAKTRFTEKKETLEERKALREENIKEKLTEIQTKRLEALKEQAAKVDARLDKTAEFLYAKLERISNHIIKREEEGFDLEAFKKKVDAIEEKIAATEEKTTQIASLYENIEELSIEEMKADFAKLKSLTKEIKNDYSDIRDEMVNLITEVE